MTPEQQKQLQAFLDHNLMGIDAFNPELTSVTDLQTLIPHLCLSDYGRRLQGFSYVNTKPKYPNILLFSKSLGDDVRLHLAVKDDQAFPFLYSPKAQEHTLETHLAHLEARLSSPESTPMAELHTFKRRALQPMPTHSPIGGHSKAAKSAPKARRTKASHQWTEREAKFIDKLQASTQKTLVEKTDRICMNLANTQSLWFDGTHLHWGEKSMPMRPNQAWLEAYQALWPVQAWIIDPNQPLPETLSEAEQSMIWKHAQSNHPPSSPIWAQLSSKMTHEPILKAMMTRQLCSEHACTWLERTLPDASEAFTQQVADHVTHALKRNPKALLTRAACPNRGFFKALYAHMPSLTQQRITQALYALPTRFLVIGTANHTLVHDFGEAWPKIRTRLSFWRIALAQPEAEPNAPLAQIITTQHLQDTPLDNQARRALIEVHLPQWQDPQVLRALGDSQDPKLTFGLLNEAFKTTRSINVSDHYPLINRCAQQVFNAHLDENFLPPVLSKPWKVVLKRIQTNFETHPCKKALAAYLTPDRLSHQSHGGQKNPAKQQAIRALQLFLRHGFLTAPERHFTDPVCASFSTWERVQCLQVAIAYDLPWLFDRFIDRTPLEAPIRKRPKDINFQLIEMDERQPQSPLYAAIAHNHVDALEAILRRAPNAVVMNYGEIGLTDLALRNGHTDILRKLLHHGAPLPHESSLVVATATAHQFDALALLRHFGVKMTDRAFRSALYFGRTDLVRQLVGEGLFKLQNTPLKHCTHIQSIQTYWHSMADWALI